MRDVIKARFKAKYPALNYSKTRLDELAAKLEGLELKDETEIDAKLDELNNIIPFADIAKQDDKIAQLEREAKKNKPNPAKKDKPEPGEEDGDDSPKPPTKEDETATLLKGLIATVNELKAEKVQTSIKSKVEAQLKEVPAKYWSKRQLPATEEEIENFVTEVTTDWQEFSNEIATDTTKSVLGNYTPPKKGNGKETAPDKKQIDELINTILPNLA